MQHTTDKCVKLAHSFLTWLCVNRGLMALRHHTVTSSRFYMLAISQRCKMLRLYMIIFQMFLWQYCVHSINNIQIIVINTLCRAKVRISVRRNGRKLIFNIMVIQNTNISPQSTLQVLHLVCRISTRVGILILATLL